MSDEILSMIEAMNKMGADNFKEMHNAIIDGFEYWIQIDIKKKGKAEDGK